MKIAVIGGTGHAGSRIVTEALERGHEVIAIARNVSETESKPGLTLVQGDVLDPDIYEVFRGADVLVSAAKFATVPAEPVVAAARNAAVARLVVVGGAASLNMPGGGRLIDQPGFPEEYRSEAEGGIRFLEYLQTVSDVNWTYISPSGNLAPGERTEKFRLGTDELLIPAAGEPGISMEDMAIAVLDEAEKPRHERMRFTVGY